MEADADTENLEQEEPDTYGAMKKKEQWKKWFGDEGDFVYTKAGKLVINTYAESSTKLDEIQAEPLPTSYFLVSSLFGVGKCVVRFSLACGRPPFIQGATERQLCVARQLHNSQRVDPHEACVAPNANNPLKRLQELS
jgi:hypothetical protein